MSGTAFVLTLAIIFALEVIVWQWICIICPNCHLLGKVPKIWPNWPKSVSYCSWHLWESGTAFGLAQTITFFLVIAFPAVVIVHCGTSNYLARISVSARLGSALTAVCGELGTRFLQNIAL